MVIQRDDTPEVFEMSFTPPAATPTPEETRPRRELGTRTGETPAATPSYIVSADFLPGNGEVVKAEVPVNGEVHKYRYSIPSGQKAHMTFTHAGHFHLEPSYAEGAADDAEGSARDHGERLLGFPPPDPVSTYPHDAAHARTVTWEISYIEDGDPTVPYEVRIELG